MAPQKQPRPAWLTKGRGRGKDDAEIARLEVAIAAGAPPPGSAAPAADAAEAKKASLCGARNFDQLPLSSPTLEGLKACKYKAMTAIQRAALPHALAGRDVLGAAKTGSGKTLAFLVPAVELLAKVGWKARAGTGAVVSGEVCAPSGATAPRFSANRVT
jgi:ATP-dependent RNA helicase DDX10/DBP4